MAEQTKITVAKVRGHVRVVVQLPAHLDVLAPRDAERLVESALTRASEAVFAFCEHERVTGITPPPASATVAAA